MAAQRRSALGALLLLCVVLAAGMAFLSPSAARSLAQPGLRGLSARSPLASEATSLGALPAACLVLGGCAFLSRTRSPRPQQGARRGAGGGVARAASAWGGDLAEEALAAASVVQRAMQLCQGLACDMTAVDPSLGKEMEECDVSAGVAKIKSGDSTPVTAADFAIQGMVAAALKKQFADDRFMGEEDAGDLREDKDLCDLAMNLCARFGGPHSRVGAHRDEFLEAVDSGLEPSRGKGERVWVLDPIDGTKGFMTGQGYVIGLALLVDGEPVVGVMGVPNRAAGPPIMVAVKGHGLRWWPEEGEGPLAYEAPQPDWARNSYEPPFKGGHAGVDYPPWLLSPQTARESCTPFGAEAPSSEVCCGAMIKYFAVAEGTHAGFVQYEEKLKTWDHACGVICVNESGGAASATDAAGAPVLFPDRTFKVKGGVVCCSRWTTPAVKECLLNAAKSNQAA